MPVLATKLHPPRPRRRLVSRARLTDRLGVGGGEAPRLVLVAAPAGFGKTTLLAQWPAADGSPRRVAWLALDRGDTDIRLFLTHLTAAIRTAEPEAGAEALALLEAGVSTPADDVLVSLINDLDVLPVPRSWRSTTSGSPGCRSSTSSRQTDEFRRLGPSTRTYAIEPPTGDAR